MRRHLFWLRFCLVVAILLWGIYTKAYPSYDMYLDGKRIGTVRNLTQAETIVDSLSAELKTTSFTPHFYLRFGRKTALQSSTELLENARQALGMKTEFKNEIISIPFQTEISKDDALHAGIKNICQKGENGEKAVTKKITMIQEQKVNEEIISETVTKEPIIEKISVGTKTLPEGTGTGTFQVPLSSFFISSPFGMRDNRTHCGIDMAADEGTIIMAADAGTVAFSGACQGYGNLIIIDHKNGFLSYYAHCSTLCVPVNVSVKKGETIAKVGSTGNSTGPHLHFEIRKNDIPENPLHYLPSA